MKKIMPSKNRILIAEYRDRVTEKGIILPDSVNDPKAIVVEVGKDVTGVKRGDIVYVTGNGAFEIKFGDIKHAIIHESNVLAVEYDDVKVN